MTQGLSPTSDDLLEELAALDGEVRTEVTVEPMDEEPEVWRSLPEGRQVLELGEVVNPPRACLHPADHIMVETLVALIEDEPPRLELRVKAICSCGIDVAVARSGRAPRDGSPGTVLELTPLPCDTRGNPD